MNREISFRAWDKHNKCFIKAKDIEHPDRISVKSKGIYFQLQSNFILSQNLCVTDKNGKWIYEGDIIKRKYFHNNPPSKRPKKKFVEYSLPVCFDGGSFHPNNTLVRNVEYGTTYGTWYKDCEVIGNIYQNPELLKPTT